MAILELEDETCVTPIKQIGTRYRNKTIFETLGFGQTGGTSSTTATLLKGDIEKWPTSECRKSEFVTDLGYDRLCYLIYGVEAAPHCTGN